MAKKKVLITGTPQYQTGGNIRGTKLSSAQEQKYQIWKNTLPKNLQYEGDYDLRGFYKENPTWTPNTPGQHMTDKYKLPNHPTFSNESMYYSPANRDSAGYWQGNMYIPYNPAVKDTVREYKKGGKIDYTQGANKPATRAHYTPPVAPQYSIGEQWAMEHPQQYMNPAPTYTPYGKQVHEYQREQRMHEAGYNPDGTPLPAMAAAKSQWATQGSGLVDKFIDADMVLGAGTLAKGVGKAILKEIPTKVISEIFRADPIGRGTFPLNANHPLINITKNAIKEGNYKDLPLIYGTATLNRLSPVLSKIKPVANAVKKRAEKYMEQSHGFSRDLVDMKNPGVNPTEEAYTGHFGNIPDRNLNKLYLYGDEKGFVPNNLEPIGLKRYQEKYGDIKSYDLDMGQRSNMGIWEDLKNEFKVKTNKEAQQKLDEIIEKQGYYSKGYEASKSPFGYKSNDNIGGHMFYISKNPEGTYTGRVQDIWKFDPRDYNTRWNIKKGKFIDEMGNINTQQPVYMQRSNYLRLKQPALLDKFGKPFILSNEFPVKVPESDMWSVNRAASDIDEWENGGKIYKNGGGIDYTDIGKRKSTVTTTQVPRSYTPPTAIDIYRQQHPQQYMRSAEGYGTPQQQRDHEYLRNKMYQQEAEERANREFAESLKGLDDLATKFMAASDIIGAGYLAKGLAKPITNRLIAEIEAVPRVINKAKNLKNTVRPTVPLSTEEANLLKNTRLVGSIHHGGGEEAVRLQSMLDKAKNMSDRDLKALTGMNKAEIEQAIENVKSSTGTKETSSINLQRSPNTVIDPEGGGIDYVVQGVDADADIYRQTVTDRIIQAGSADNLYRGQLDAEEYGRRMTEFMTRSNQLPAMDIDAIRRSMGTQRNPVNTVADKLYNQWAKGKTQGFLPQTPQPITESLIPSLAKNPHNNPASRMVSAYKKVKDAPKGSSFIPAHSLSEDSYPMSMKLIQKAQQEGLGDIQYHGHMPLNTMGFPAKAGLDPKLILRENNQIIDAINQGRTQKIPYGYIENGSVRVPQVTIQRKKEGGIVYTKGANKPATVTTTQSPGYVPQYSVGEQYPLQYTDFGPVTPLQRQYEGKGMPKSLIPNELQQNQYGGNIMKKKVKITGTPEMADGGSVPGSFESTPTEWGYAQPMANMNNPMYQDYGNSYKVDNWSGLYSKPFNSVSNNSVYQFYGAAPVDTPITQGYYATNRPLNMDLDAYSIDRLRVQDMAYGGYAGQTPPDSRGRRSLSTPWMGSVGMTKGMPDEYSVKDVIPNIGITGDYVEGSYHDISMDKIEELRKRGYAIRIL